MSETNKHDYYLIPNLQTIFGYDTVIYKSKLIYILIQLRNFYINCNLIGLFNILNLVKNVIGCLLLAVFSKNFDMFVWTSGFQKSLAHTDFNMFVDEWTSANESPDPWEPDTPPKQTPPPPTQCMLGDTVNKPAVCILLECNLVCSLFSCDQLGS